MGPMVTGPILSQTGLDLPMQPGTGAVILGVGLIIVAIVAYDIYRQHWQTEEGKNVN